MSKRKRSLPNEIRMPDGQRYIPVVLKVQSRHENGVPYELDCQPDDQHIYELSTDVKKNQFVIAYVCEKSFPGYDTHEKPPVT